MADVAQLARAPGCGSGGRGFETRRLPHFLKSFLLFMDLIILFIVTAYIFYRLSKNLGKIDEEEKHEIHKKLLERKKQIEEILNRVQQNSPNQCQNKEEKIIGASSTTQKEFAVLNQATQENLTKIFEVCNISYEFFINGAKMAFEMIINAFAKEDIETLKILLSEKIFQGFNSAIEDRKSKEYKLTTNLISIDKVEILSAMLIENQASIVVKIISKQINYISDNDQKIIEGKKDEISEIIDIWTFKKDVKSPNPNWLVSATSS